MRAIWKGAVSFGLVNVPVRLFAATQEHDIRFHQVHRADGGRIRMKRICSVCGEEVSYDQLAKGYEAEDGRLVVLTDDDFESLPLATGHEIDVVEFVPNQQVDPILYARSYYLEPDARAAKPYALLREALETTERVAVVKVALRQRESLAVLRVRDRVIMLQTLLWPDEVRAADFPILAEEVELRPQEMRMAASLVDSMATDFEPDAFEDDYQKALFDLVEAKLEGAAPAPVQSKEEASTEVVDLLSALQASVDRARSARGESGGSTSKTADQTTVSTSSRADSDAEEADQEATKASTASTTKASASKESASKASASKAPAKRAASKAPAAKKAPAKTTASKTTAKTTKKAPARRSA